MACARSAAQGRMGRISQWEAAEPGTYEKRGRVRTKGTRKGLHGEVVQERGQGGGGNGRPYTGRTFRKGAREEVGTEGGGDARHRQGRTPAGRTAEVPAKPRKGNALATGPAEA